MIPPASSEGAEPQPGDPPAPPPPADPPAPTAEEAAAAEAAATARAAVHPEADAYAVNLDDTAKEALGLGDADPLVAGLQKFAAESGKPQGWMDDVLEGAAELAKQGLFDSGLDPAAEAAKLGDNAAGRRREVEVFGEALKSRGEIDDAEFGELMSLSPTAAGVTLIEKLRKMMTDTGIPKPGGAVADPAEAAKTKAQEMAADPKYGNDRRFTREADAAWKTAYGGRT